MLINNLNRSEIAGQTSIDSPYVISVDELADSAGGFG